MGQPAARKGDKIMCPLPNPPLAPPKPPTYLLHTIPAGNEISMIADSHNVEIGGAQAARVGDFSKCDLSESPKILPNPILKGSIPVMIGNKPAARATDNATHPGSMILPPCCPTVLIGLAGCGGNPFSGKDDCEAAAAGRKSGSTQQSFQNCGVESARQIVNRASGAGVNEQETLAQAINSNNAAGSIDPSGQIDPNSGGTGPAGREDILDDFGVGSHTEAPSMANFEQAALNGQGQIASVDSQSLWSGGQNMTGNIDHAVTVTGVKYDANGDIEAVIINDTGTGKCGQEVPIAVWLLSVGSVPTNVTDNPIF